MTTSKHLRSSGLLFNSVSTAADAMYVRACPAAYIALCYKLKYSSASLVVSLFFRHYNQK